jgi:outer membrane protein OmpA-like peptidoglycan-associated protein
MRTTRRLGVLLVVFVMAGFVASTRVAAEEETAPSWDFGFLLGGGFPDDPLVGEAESQKFNLLYGLRLGHRFTERWGLFADGILNPLDGNTALGDVDEQAVQAGVEYILNPNSNGRFFVSGGVGNAWYKPELGASDFDGIRYSLGFGQRFAMDETARLRWEIRGLQTTLDEEDLGGEDLTNIQALLGFSWGTASTPVDTDGDGVRDKKDACPDTPRGATVDEKGCPKDSDGDGVFDGLDRCPDTPKGVKVDASGCSMDSDGDGVFDGPDACPDTPKGATVDEKGCPKDTDGDGVFDGLDRCPDTPKGVKVNSSGCPLDSDGDGVNDDKDRCPDTPRGTQVDATGCPPPPPPPSAIPERGQALVLEGVNFEYDSAKLTPDSTAALNLVADSLKANPEARIEIGGHTDSRGKDSYNLQLSRKRAQAVQDYLVGQGVSPAQASVTGYGEKQPVAPNDTEDGRAKNRRVELKRLD